MASKYLWKSVPQWICLSATERNEVLSRFFASNSVDETGFENRVAYDTASSYVNHFLKIENCLPQKHGGANYVVVSDWIQAYIESPLLYLSEIRETPRERDQDDLQLQPHEAPSISAIRLCIQ